MFVDQFSLSKNSWHAKLMNYIWGFKTHDFSHICPYFWLSILNVIIFIPFAILKTLGRGLVVIINKSSELFDEKYDQWEKQYLKKLHNDPAELQRFAEERECNKRFKKLWSNIADRYWGTGSYSTIFKEVVRIRTEIEDKASEEKERKRLSNKQRINKINKVFKPIAQVIIALAAIATVAAVIYGIYLIIIYNPVKRINWKELFTVLGIIITISIITVIIAYFIARFIQYMKNRNKCNKPTLVGNLFNGIGKFFSICFQMIKNNCPAIKWED